MRASAVGVLGNGKNQGGFSPGPIVADFPLFDNPYPLKPGHCSANVGFCFDFCIFLSYNKCCV